MAGVTLKNCQDDMVESDSSWPGMSILHQGLYLLEFPSCLQKNVTLETLGVIDLCAFLLGLDDHKYFHSLLQFAVCSKHKFPYCEVHNYGTEVGTTVWTPLSPLGFWDSLYEQELTAGDTSLCPCSKPKLFPLSHSAILSASKHSPIDKSILHYYMTLKDLGIRLKRQYICSCLPITVGRGVIHRGW